MKAQLRRIEHNDFFAGWDAFAAQPSSDPWNDFGWLTLTIGPEGDPGTNYFQLLVSTPAAAGRARGEDRYFRGILVEKFEAAVIERTVRQFVESLEGTDWPNLVDQLRPVMHWEYEGM